MQIDYFPRVILTDIMKRKYKMKKVIGSWKDELQAEGVREMERQPCKSGKIYRNMEHRIEELVGAMTAIVDHC